MERHKVTVKGNSHTTLEIISSTPVCLNFYSHSVYLILDQLTFPFLLIAILKICAGYTTDQQERDAPQRNLIR